VARYADEWNAVYLSITELKARNELLDQLLADQGRQPGEVRRSLMTGCVFAHDQAGLDQAVQQRTQGRLTAAELRQRGLVVGTAPQVAEQLKAIEASGVPRVMLQWLDLDDIAGLEALAKGVLAQL
ncbi:MAG: hypothetical protein JW862_16075, partial [Anaerolineales bacterium]|nr:hypothetical protein [Anaerolineales bacterium]